MDYLQGTQAEVSRRLGLSIWLLTLKLLLCSLLSTSKIPPDNLYMPLSAMEDSLSRHFTILITNIARPETSISLCGLTQLDNIKGALELHLLSIIYKYNKIRMIALILVLCASLTILMRAKSKTDYTLFFCNLFLFGLLAFAFSIPFWKTDFFRKVGEGSTNHILLGLGYVIVFIVLPICALSWTAIRFTIHNRQITVVDWFGLRHRTFSLPAGSGVTVKRETAPYRFKIFPFNSRYNEYKSLYIQTLEGKRLRIQSRYMKNFGQLNIAIKKAST